MMKVVTKVDKRMTDYEQERRSKAIYKIALLLKSEGRENTIYQTRS